jgi:hypothetical protein
MTEIKWEAPPAALVGPRNRYEEFRSALRANPGQWAIFREDVKWDTALSAYRNAATWSGFEVVARPSGSGFTYYARYVGDEASA